MDQDDPCILSLLRGQYLHPPSKNKLNLEAPEVTNPSMGQAQSILEILKNKVLRSITESLYACFNVYCIVPNRKMDFLWNVEPWMANFVQTLCLWNEI